MIEPASNASILAMSTVTAAPTTAVPAAGHPRDGRPVARWAKFAAHLVPLTTLPSGLWRLALAAGLSMGISVNGVSGSAYVTGPGETAYVVGLSLVAESAALLTFGLVRPWGERAPAWMPWIGGRRLAPYAVIVPAALGTISLALIWSFVFYNMGDLSAFGFTGLGWKILLVASYAPLAAWAPLLGAVAFAYYRRRGWR